jgi:hypothetical protein
MARMLLTLLCDLSAHFTCTFTLWFNLGNPQEASVPIHMNCWRVAWSMGFGCSICRACNCISVLRVVQNVVMLKHVTMCFVIVYQQPWRENKLLFLQRFCLPENVSHNAWLDQHNWCKWVFSLIKARKLLTFLWDWAAHLHMYLYTVIQPGRSTGSKCATTHKLLEGGINIGFWVFDRSCLHLFFCCAIGAEYSVADSCNSVSFVIVPATMTWN